MDLPRGPAARVALNLGLLVLDLGIPGVGRRQQPPQ
uniref:Uncharacterized protein n=1 Tax=Setaria viridis TaxID=4556 RepID=A0A4U6U4X5_SETVI|nr:hypothetical protein SEVIR_6G078350v2 [Setaria viridis]